MPKELERKLKAEAARKFPGDKERQDAYTVRSDVPAGNPRGNGK